MFDDIDRDGNGSIDKTELVKALKILKVNTSTRDVDMLFDRFDDSKRGRLDYHNYLELLGYQRSADAARRASPRVEISRPSPRLSPRSKDRLEMLVTRLQKKLEETLGTEANSAKRIKEGQLEFCFVLFLPFLHQPIIFFSILFDNVQSLSYTLHRL